LVLIPCCCLSNAIYGSLRINKEDSLDKESAQDEQYESDGEKKEDRAPL